MQHFTLEQLNQYAQQIAQTFEMRVIFADSIFQFSDDKFNTIFIHPNTPETHADIALVKLLMDVSFKKFSFSQVSDFKTFPTTSFYQLFYFLEQARTLTKFSKKWMGTAEMIEPFFSISSRQLVDVFSIKSPINDPFVAAGILSFAKQMQINDAHLQSLIDPKTLKLIKPLLIQTPSTSAVETLNQTQALYNTLNKKNIDHSNPLTFIQKHQVAKHIAKASNRILSHSKTNLANQLNALQQLQTKINATSQFLKPALTNIKERKQDIREVKDVLIEALTPFSSLTDLYTQQYQAQNHLSDMQQQLQKTSDQVKKQLAKALTQNQKILTTQEKIVQKQQQIIQTQQALDTQQQNQATQERIDKKTEQLNHQKQMLDNLNQTLANHMKKLTDAQSQYQQKQINEKQTQQKVFEAQQQLQQTQTMIEEAKKEVEPAFKDLLQQLNPDQQQRILQADLFNQFMHNFDDQLNHSLQTDINTGSQQTTQTLKQFNQTIDQIESNNLPINQLNQLIDQLKNQKQHINNLDQLLTMHQQVMNQKDAPNDLLKDVLNELKSLPNIDSQQLIQTLNHAHMPKETIDQTQQAIDQFNQFQTTLTEKTEKNLENSNIPQITQDIFSQIQKSQPALNDLQSMIDQALNQLKDEKQTLLNNQINNNPNLAFDSQFLNIMKQVKSDIIDTLFDQTNDLMRQNIETQNLSENQKIKSIQNNLQQAHQQQHLLQQLQGFSEQLTQENDAINTEESLQQLNDFLKQQINSNATNPNQSLSQSLNQLADSINQPENKQEALKQLQQLIDELQSSIDNSPQLSMDDYFSTNSIDQLKQELQKLLEQQQDKSTLLKSQQERVEKPLNDLKAKLQLAQQKIKQTQAEFFKESAKELIQMQMQAMAQNLPFNALPPLLTMPGWAKADEIQNKFDTEFMQKSGELVRNGVKNAGNKGSSLQTMLLNLDKDKEHFEQIDPTNFFHEQVQPVGTEEGVVFDLNNTIEPLSEEQTYKLVRASKGIACKDFDNTTYQTNSSNFNLTQLMQPIHSTEQQLIDWFKRNFKTSFKDTFKGGLEEGQLDARSLWKLPANMGNDIYEEVLKKPIKEHVVSIVLDLSGSLDKDYTNHGLKLKQLTALLAQALNACKIDFEIVGYHHPIEESLRETISTTQRADYIRSTHRFEQIIFKSFNQKDLSGIDNIKIYPSDNNDGEAIDAALKRLKKQKAKHKSIFYINDGMPLLTDSTIDVLDEFLMMNLARAQKQKVSVLSFGFNPEPAAYYKTQHCHIQSENFQETLSFFEQFKLNKNNKHKFLPT